MGQSVFGHDATTGGISQTYIESTWAVGAVEKLRERPEEKEREREIYCIQREREREGKKPRDEERARAR